MTSDVQVSDNAPWALATPRLSVLIPYHGDDPRPLLITLDALARSAAGAVELVVLDDGVPDADLAGEVRLLLRSLRTPARHIANPRNEGRSRGRNRLVAAARARHLLLLDSDMAPDAPDFLQRYLALASDDTALAFGGFTVASAPDAPATALHKGVQALGECLPAARRRLDPERYVFTSNLLVRRDVLLEEPFDEGFCGWGWEDVDWGLRAGARYSVLQIDNPATHLGLDAEGSLIRKYEESVGNFARLLSRHEGAVRRFPLHRWAVRLKAAPCLPLVRRILRATALRAGVPMALRVRALKAYRAALYAEVV